MKSGTLQAKLKINRPDNIYEQEADRKAKQVQGAVPSGSLQRKGARIIRSHVADDFLQSIGSGQALDSSTSSLMESQFGYDFSSVRVHYDDRADELARAVNAKAFTVQQDMIFGKGQYEPDTISGRRLLAHELTHVVQQSPAINNVAEVNQDKIPLQNSLSPCIQRDVSFELKDAAIQPVTTTLKDLSNDEMHVLAWLRKYKDTIVAAEKTYCVDRRAIAGAIGWEALENVRGWSLRSVGPGKVHYKTAFWERGTTTLEQTEKAGYLPSMTEETRKEMLATPEGSINAIAAIMKADADAISGYINIYRDPGMLATFYNAWKLDEVKRLAKEKIANRKPNEMPGLIPNEMGIWVYNHHIFLEEAVGKPDTSASKCIVEPPKATEK